MTIQLPELPDAAAQVPARRKLLVFTVMAFGMFMALIDIWIVAAPLRRIVWLHLLALAQRRVDNAKDQAILNTRKTL